MVIYHPPAAPTHLQHQLTCSTNLPTAPTHLQYQLTYSTLWETHQFTASLILRVDAVRQASASIGSTRLSTVHHNSCLHSLLLSATLQARLICPSCQAQHSSPSICLHWQYQAQHRSSQQLPSLTTTLCEIIAGQCAGKSASI